MRTPETKPAAPMPSPHVAPSPRRRGLGRRLGLLAFGLAAGLGVCEAALRVLWPHLANGVRVYDFAESERGRFCRWDERLGWAGRPGAEGEFQWADCRIRVRQNRHGFRGAEHETARTDRPRIAVLGDSFVWGFGVEEPDVFTAVMARDSARDVEIVNLGVSGYGTDQEVLLWERDGRLFRPDHLVLCVTLANDLDEILYDSTYDYAKPVFRIGPDGAPVLLNVPVPARTSLWEEPAIRTKDAWHAGLPGLLRRSAVANVVLGAAARVPSWRASLEEARILPRTRDDGDWELPQYETPPAPSREASWDLLVRLLVRLRESAARDGADLTVVAIPSVLQVEPDLWTKTVARHPEAASRLVPDLPQRRLAEACRAAGVPVVDLLPPLRAAAHAGDALYYPLNLHWTPAGHRVAAAALLEHFGLRRPR
jgi:hypothetical protein